MARPGGSDLATAAERGRTPERGPRAERELPARSKASSTLAALATAMASLVDASGSVTEAITRHDRIALESANERADALVGRVSELGAALTETDRSLLPETPIPALGEQLAASARRNAYLIEQAWAIDAALLRLMVGAGQADPDSAVAGYNAAAGPACVDRGA